MRDVEKKLHEKGTKMCIRNTLYPSYSKMKLLSIKEIKYNGYDSEIVDKKIWSICYKTFIVYRIIENSDGHALRD